MGGTLQAHPQEPPEVYSNLLSPSVGETTGRKHPIAPQVDVSTAGKHRPARTEDRR